MPNESAWRDRFLFTLREVAKKQQVVVTHLILNVSNQRGVPDTWVHFYSTERGVRSSALLEFKKGRGLISEVQKARIVGLSAVGVYAGVIRLLDAKTAMLETITQVDTNFRVLPLTDREQWADLAVELIYQIGDYHGWST